MISELRVRTPSWFKPCSMAGSEASELCVEIATACAGIAARKKTKGFFPAPANAITKLSSQITEPVATSTMT